VGVAAESNVIRIGTKGIQTEAFIAGIYNHTLTGNVVVVTSAGRLGVQAVSSERYKTAIAPMGSDTAKLQQLRPVSFKLKSDAKGTRQYGLIAEEVAKVYPELVIRDESGRIDGVRYDELAPMLLNQAQQQQGKFEAQAAQLRDLQQQFAVMQAAFAKLQAKDTLVAQR
jgi:Chaperone of endosialidase